MDKKPVATTNPLAVAAMSPIAVAEVEQNNRALAALTPAEREIYKGLDSRIKEYSGREDEFYASLSEEERRIFNKGMTAARKEGGRRSRRSRRSIRKMLSTLYNKMTHTRKHRSGGSGVPDWQRRIALGTIYRTAAQVAKNKAHAREIAEEKAEKARKHAHAMAHPRRSARLAAKKRGGTRRGTRRGTR